MNTQTPAPQRRRRRPPLEVQNAAPHMQQEAPRSPLRESQTAIYHVKTPAVRPLPGERRSKVRRKAGLFHRIPRAARAAIGFVLIVCLLTCAVAVTRSYLAAQEERRRLEAEAAERAQHPLYYEDAIRANASVQGVDPSLVAAIILCESSYDPQAVSRLGARGLMQLMEDTAEWVAHKLDEDDADYSFDLLFDPETNIRFGTWYLGYLSRRFDGDAKKIVCAYHAGQGNVDSWLSNPAYSSDGVTLETIPTQDTASYANRVLKAQAVYQKYYFAPEPGEGDPSSVN